MCMGYRFDFLRELWVFAYSIMNGFAELRYAKRLWFRAPGLGPFAFEHSLTTQHISLYDPCVDGIISVWLAHLDIEYIHSVLVLPIFVKGI